MLSFYLSQHHSEKTALGQDWIKKAKMIRCLAPLPEGSPDPVLTRMLECAPYQAPLGEDEGRNKEAKSGIHALIIKTGGISVSMKEDNRGEESRIPSPQGRKRTAPEDLETRVSKREKKPSPGGLTRRASFLHSARKGVSPPPSCK